MSHLVAIVFDSCGEALTVRRILAREDKRRPVEMADAAVVYRDNKDRIRVDRATGHKGVGFLVGGLFGALLGLMLPLPFEGAAVSVFAGAFGAGLGSLGAGLLDKETGRDIMDEIGASVEEGKAALLLLVENDKIEVVLNDLSGHPGKVVKTSLSPEWEEKLHAVMMTHRKSTFFTERQGQTGTQHHNDARM